MPQQSVHCGRLTPAELPEGLAGCATMELHEGLFIQKHCLMPCFLVCLQRLVLCHNSLFTVAGPPLRSLPALRVLLLDHNKISELPEEVAWLSRLEKLSITHNTLTGRREYGLHFETPSPKMACPGKELGAEHSVLLWAGEAQHHAQHCDG